MSMLVESEDPFFLSLLEFPTDRSGKSSSKRSSLSTALLTMSMLVESEDPSLLSFLEFPTDRSGKSSSKRSSLSTAL